MMVGQDPAVARGRPWPLGVTLCADSAGADSTGADSAGAGNTGANVAVWAPDADAVYFCLFDDAGTETRIPLPCTEGGIWHAHIAGVEAGARYGLRVDGPFQPEAGQRFNVHKLLIDPYARALDAPLRWHPLMTDTTLVASGDAAGREPTLDRRDSASVVPKGVVLAEAAGPDPAANRPRHDRADLIIYEAHVKGLTAAHPDVPEELRGTYAGMAHPAIVEHLVTLGVNAVELLPVQAFIDDQHLVGKGLSNYWGYQPIAWLAPEPRYARSRTGVGADAELRHLVHTLHEAGIEVIVDVVYNHTGEGDAHGPTIAYRGLQDAGYYRHSPIEGEGLAYINDTGTGNTVAADRPMVMRLILDSLRHWAERYGIDGFRFDLGTVLGRASHGRAERGFDAEAAFFQAIQQDPVLAGVKMIAEPWDLGPGGYQLGSFPYPWSEWNDQFRDGVRRAWRGDAIGQVGIGSLLLGSAGHFDHSGRPATSSVNFITAHDGFTLADVVSYSRKHNEANGEGGRDGHDENHSDNLGVEGPSDDPAVRAARARGVGAMLAILLVSQGTPMLLAGDEIGNSQGGNNNAYAQDNPVGWIDWPAADVELLEMVRRLVSVRRRHPILRQGAFLHGGERRDGHRDIVWRRADGVEPNDADWHDPELRCIVAELRGAAGVPQGEALGGAVLLILNTGDDLEVQLPDPGDGMWWRVQVDTARPERGSPGDAGEAPGGAYAAAAQSVVVLSTEPPSLGATDDPNAPTP